MSSCPLPRNMRSNSKRQLYSDKAYQLILQNVIRLEYYPGMQLEEKQLVQTLEIGRTPIREALLRLQEELLIDSEPKKGFFIKPITLQNTRAVLEVLRILKNGVATLAFNHKIQAMIDRMEKANEKAGEAIKEKSISMLFDANRSYHAWFAECSFNPYLIKGLKQIGNEVERLNYLILRQESSTRSIFKTYFHNEWDQHNEIITAMRDKNNAQIENLISEHIQAFKERIIAYLN